MSKLDAALQCVYEAYQDRVYTETVLQHYLAAAQLEIKRLLISKGRIHMTSYGAPVPEVAQQEFLKQLESRWDPEDAAALMPLILNGRASQNDIPECVAIETDGFEYTCSGIMIHPQWVITSEHCTEATSMFIGDDIAEAQPDATEFAVIDNDVVIGDVRLLRVDGQIEEPPIAVLADECEFLGDAHFVGYGVTVPTRVPGVKRLGAATIVHNKEEIITERVGADNVCFGDSGGALVVRRQDQWITYGMIQESVRPNCESGAIYTKLDRALIEEIEARTGVTLRRCPPPQETAPGASAEAAAKLKVEHRKR